MRTICCLAFALAVSIDPGIEIPIFVPLSPGEPLVATLPSQRDEAPETSPDDEEPEEVRSSPEAYDEPYFSEDD